jgi:hypothetical protein
MNHLIGLIIFLFGINSYGQVCSPVNAKTGDAAEYLGKMAESLTHVKLQFGKIASLRSKKNTSAVDALVALKELKAGYFCSANMIGVYKVSKNENISQSADTLARVYQMLGIGVDESIAEIKASLDGKTLPSPGEQADRDSEKMIDVKKKWEIAFLAIGIGTYSAVGEKNPKTQNRLKRRKRSLKHPLHRQVFPALCS